MKSKAINQINKLKDKFKIRHTLASFHKLITQLEVKTDLCLEVIPLLKMLRMLIKKSLLLFNQMRMLLEIKT